MAKRRSPIFTCILWAAVAVTLKNVEVDSQENNDHCLCSPDDMTDLQREKLANLTANIHLEFDDVPQDFFGIDEVSLKLCECDIKTTCSEDPPERSYMDRIWDSSRYVGSKIAYQCAAGYRSVTEGVDMTGVECQEDGTWSTLPDNFKCEKILCPLTIPKVPAFGRTDWSEAKPTHIGTTILYTCLPDHVSTRNNELVQTVCREDGTWSPIPSDFDCVDKEMFVKMGLSYQVSFDHNNMLFNQLLDDVKTLLELVRKLQVLVEPLLAIL